MSNAVLERLSHTVANLAARLRHLETQEIVAANLPAHASRHASDGADELAILAEQSANTVLAGPTTGAATDPAYRALVAADLPITLAHGTYTPTLTNVANLDASTAYVCQYLRVGSVVTVSGVVDVDPTLTATTTRLGISLPVASDFASDVQCGGVAAAIAAASESAGIYADATNNRAELRWICGVTANTSLRFTFTYLVV